MKTRLLLPVLILFVFTLSSNAQQATFLKVGTGLQDEAQTPFGGNEGASIKAELKMATALNLPGDYHRTINLALYPWYDAGWGHSYNINVNWSGIYYRRSNNQNTNLWDGWCKVIMTAWWDNSVEIPGTLFAKGDVKVGSASSPKQLDVHGVVRAREVRVESSWADFVFKPDYKLLPLEEVKAHIEEHRHLPGIPSEAEVKDNGIALSDMTTKMMQKIEELTLYAIQQNETIEKLNKRLEELENSK